MARPIRIAAQLQPQQTDYRDIRAAAVAAEEKGVDIIFNWDHFFPLYGDMEGKHFECWTMLASWAEVTERVEIGALVTCYSYRNPHLLADMARTVDHISEGRLILGLGSGWFERDYEEYGYTFGTAAGRLRTFGAGMDLIKGRFSQLNPAPTRPIPILIGGGGEKLTLPIVAQHGDIWHSFGDPQVFQHKSGVLDRACQQVGRDPSAIERSITPPGGPETAQDYVDLGATMFVLAFGGPQYDLAPLDEWVAWRDEYNA